MYEKFANESMGGIGIEKLLMPKFSNSFKNFFSIREVVYFTSQATSPLLSFLMMIFFAKAVSPEVYGEYIIAISSVSVMSLLCSGWISTTVLRFCSVNEPEQSIVLQTLFNLQLLASVIVGCLSFIISRFVEIFPGLSISASIFILLYMLFFTSCDLFLCYFRAVDNPIRYQRVSLVLQALKVSTGVLALFLVNNFYYVFAGWAIVYFSGWLFCVLKFKLVYISKILRFDAEILNDSIKYGIPLVFTSAGGLAVTLSDRYMLNWLGSTADVSTYSVTSVILYTALGVLATSLVMSSYAKIVSAWESTGSINELMGKKIENFLVVLIPAAIGIYNVLPELISSILPEAYGGGVVISSYLVVAVFFSLLIQYYQKSFIVQKRMKLYASIYLFYAIVNIVLNYWMIQENGIIGAAQATALSFLFLWLTLFIVNIALGFFWKVRGMVFFKIGVSSFLMLLVLLLVGNFDFSREILLVLKVLLGCACYYGVMTFFGFRFKDLLNG